jgi:cytochrome c oxidase subunit 1
LYETLFWGGGHVLQFAYVQIMVTAWLILSKPHPMPKLLWVPFIVALLSSVLIYATKPVESAEHITLFTKQMIWLSAVGVLLVLPFIRTRNLAVIYSIALFILGGSLGHMIGPVSTTVIPAHYHGSVMAVTIALMGLAYYKLGLKPHKWQLSIYFIGQAIHVICMAVMGFHGASRKTPGDMGEHTAKAWAHIMDTGGLLVLIGGIMFVVIILRNLKPATSRA